MAVHSRNAWVTVLAVAIPFAMAFISTGRCLGNDGPSPSTSFRTKTLAWPFLRQWARARSIRRREASSTSPSRLWPRAATTLTPRRTSLLRAIHQSIWTSSPTTGAVASQTWTGVGLANQDDWADVYFNGTLLPITSGTTGGTNPPFYASVADISIYVDALGTGAPQVSNAEHVAETSEGGGAYLPSGMITTGTAGFPRHASRRFRHLFADSEGETPSMGERHDANGNVGNMTLYPPAGVAIYDLTTGTLVTGPIGVPATGLQKTYAMLTDQTFTSSSYIMATFAWDVTNASGTAQDFARVTPTVTVDHISWQIGGSTWSTSSSLTVAQGTTVAFQAFPNPRAAWPSGQPVWGGTSGASGTGGTASVTFSTASSNYQTVTATCGNTATVYVLVGSFALSLSADDNFTGRSLVRVGVGETGGLAVQLGTGMNLSDFTPFTWSVTGGTALTLSNTSSNGTARFTAGDVKGDVTVTLTDKTGHSVNYAVTVVEPTNETASVFDTFPRPAGQRSANMKLHVSMNPTDVSFSKVKILEISGDSTDFGGYFKDPGFPLTHSAITTPAQPKTPGNITDDMVECGFGTSTITAGHMTWNVPVHWQVSGGTGWDDSKPIRSLPDRIMTFESKDDQTVIVRKLGKWLSRKLTDDTIQYGQ